MCRSRAQGEIPPLRGPTRNTARKKESAHFGRNDRPRGVPRDTSWGEPRIEVFADKGIVVEMRISGVDAGDFVNLAGTESLLRIEAPGSFKEALATQDFVKARDAAGELIGGVEESGVGIGNFDTFAKKSLWHSGVGLRDGVTFVEQLDGAARPDGPVAKEAADDSTFDNFSTDLKNEWREKIQDDVVVVAGVKGDVTARLGDGANYVERLITIKRSDFDGDDVFDFGKLSPEVVGENAAADRGLKIKADDGNDLRDGTAVSEEFGVGNVLERREAEETSMVVEIGKEGGFFDRLGSFAADSADAEKRNGAIAIGVIHFFCSEF